MPQIDPDGREDAYFMFKRQSPIAEGATANAYLNGEWVPLDWWDIDVDDPKLLEVARRLKITAEEVTAGTAKIGKVLIAGPGAQENPAATVVLVRNRNPVRTRVIEDGRETIVRGGDAIDVVPT